MFSRQKHPSGIFTISASSYFPQAQPAKQQMKPSVYTTEFGLVRQFLRVLRRGQGPWGPVRLAREFQFDRGRTDVLALTATGHLLAFEAKLTKWKDALDQAYRNTCFAHGSYVLLPRHVAERVSLHSPDFRYRNVGLCYVDGSVVSVAVSASLVAPPELWLLEEARKTVQRQHGFHKLGRNCAADMPEAPFEFCGSCW